MKKLVLLVFVFCSFFVFDNAIAQTPVTIFDGNVEASYPLWPFYWYSQSQSIYLAADLSAQMGAGAKTISGLRWEWDGTNGGTNRNVDVYLGNTSKNSFANTTDYVTSSNLILVYSGTLDVSSISWSGFTFDTDFEYNGTDNLVIMVDDNTNIDISNSTRKFTSIDPDGGSTDNRTIYNNAASNYTVSNPNFSSFDDNVPSLELTYTDLSDFTWTGAAGDNNWNTVANWDSPSGTPASAAPTSSDNCIIASTADANITSGGVCNNLTINSDATFSLQDGGPAIIVTGDLLVGGLNSSLTTGSLTVNGSATISSGAKILISNGTLNARGAFDATGATIEFSGTGEVTGTIALSDAVTAIGTITNTSAGGTIKYMGVANQTVHVPAAGGAYYNLTIENASTKTAAGNLNVDGNLTTEAVASCILDLSIYDLNLAGNLTVGYRGGLDASDAACAITFDGNSTITHAGSNGGGTSNIYTMNDDGSNMTDFNTPTNAWQTNSSLFSTGSQSWHSVYTSNADNSTQTLNTFDLSDVSITSATLSFDHICKTEGFYDDCYIYYSTDGGLNYSIMPTAWYDNGDDGGYYSSNQVFNEDSYTAWGTSNVTPQSSWWETETFDISSLIGQSNVRFMFRLIADGSIERYGWLIDNIQVTKNSIITSIDPTFNSIIVNSENGDVTLASPVDVTTALTFTKGDIITTATNYLNAGSATITGGGNTSHVQGTLKRTLANNVPADFPVGNGTILKKVTITPPDVTSRVWTIDQVNSGYSNLDVSGDIDHVSPSNYWDISPSSSAANTILELTWGTNPGIDEPDLSNIVLSHYNSTDGYWEEIITTPSGGPASGSISGTVSNFSPFALGSKSSGNVLPIDLISFTANCKEDVVEVDFSVASQQNNDYFLVERSIDGVEWAELGTLQGENKSTNHKDYSILDFTPIDGMSYYRLTQVDFDGKFKVFPPIYNSCNSKETNLSMVVYPIPVINEFTFEISLDDYQGSDVFYNIINMQGAIVLTGSLELNKGFNAQTIDIDQLTSGIYMLSVNNSKSAIPKTKIIKK